MPDSSLTCHELTGIQQTQWWWAKQGAFQLEEPLAGNRYAILTHLIHLMLGWQDNAWEAFCKKHSTRRHAKYYFQGHPQERYNVQYLTWSKEITVNPSMFTAFYLGLILNSCSIPVSDFQRTEKLLIYLPWRQRYWNDSWCECLGFNSTFHAENQAWPLHLCPKLGKQPYIELDHWSI